MTHGDATGARLPHAGSSKAVENLRMVILAWPAWAMMARNAALNGCIQGLAPVRLMLN
jgi:hypothetical protein